MSVECEENPEFKASTSMEKRYVSYDTLPVAKIIKTEGNTDELNEDKDDVRSRILGLMKGFNYYRDFLSSSPPADTIFHGKTAREVPSKKIKDISSQYVSAFCAPSNCLPSVHRDDLSRMQIVDGISSWDENEDFAYGMATSLYETLPSGQYAGDPVADSLAIVTRENCAILALADGVSWGPKSKLASNCSVYGSTTYLCNHINECTSTKEVFTCILKAFEHAQACIVEEDATLTTLCVAVVIQLQERDKWCLCVVNVGDSYAYVYNKDGVKEVTHGSHPIDEARDMRYSGGALGPADGYNPDLGNLTCSLVTLDEGDVVFLCSDGISDNFDPSVAKFVPRFKTTELMEKYSTTDFTVIGKLSPQDSPKDSKDIRRKESSYRRHQSLGDIFERSTLSQDYSINLNKNEDNPNKVIYFQFDKKNPENIVESTILLDCNDENDAMLQSHENKLSNENLYQHNNGHFDNSKHRQSIISQHCIDIDDVDKDILRYKAAMLSDGVELTPRERHYGALEQMKEVISTVAFEPINQGSAIRAVDICAQIMNFVINRTAEKREILEEFPESELYNMTSEERKVREQTIKIKLKDVPGKLDHASIVAYEVGIHSKSSPLKLDLSKSPPRAESLEEKNSFNGTKNDNSTGAVNSRGRGSYSLRHYNNSNHGKQALSHFM